MSDRTYRLYHRAAIQIRNEVEVEADKAAADGFTSQAQSIFDGAKWLSELVWARSFAAQERIMDAMVEQGYEGLVKRVTRRKLAL